MVGYDEQNVSPIVIARSVSDEAIQPLARNWIASLTLAMTGRQVPFGANERMKVIGLAGWSGAGKTTPAASAVDTLRTPRLDGFLSRMSFALGAVALLIALCILAAKAHQITGLQCHYSPTIAP